MERIAMQSECDRELAERVLAWISFAYRPLSLNELQIALSVSAGMSTINSDDFEDELILTSVCAGLVVIDEVISFILFVSIFIRMHNCNWRAYLWQTTLHKNISKPDKNLYFHMPRRALSRLVLHIYPWGSDQGRLPSSKSATQICHFELGTSCTGSSTRHHYKSAVGFPLERVQCRLRQPSSTRRDLHSR